MRIETGQHQRLEQRMKLTPRMIQSMEILQLPAQALEERIEQELATNPTLDLREPGGEEAAETEDEATQSRRDAHEGERELVVRDGSDDQSRRDDFERLSNLTDEYAEQWADNTFEAERTWTTSSQRLPRDTGERDGKMDAMANAAARPQSLADQLMAQWHQEDVPDDIRRAGDFLIGFIDDDGYLRTDRQTLLSQAPPGITDETLDEALHALQRGLDPPGLVARDLRECLLLQIDMRIESERELDGDNEQLLEEFALQRRLVSDHLKDIEINRLPRVAEALGVSVDEVKRAIVHLRRYHPHPGRLLVQDTPQVVRPDVIVEYDEVEDRYVAYLARDYVPGLTINSGYEQMGRDGNVDAKTRQFVNESLRSARWLMDAIEQRNSTLLRVVNVVIEAQRAFFDQGPQYLRPLPMTAVADQLGIHVATVSRAVSEKYIQTPRGIYPLRMFFTGGTETESGESVSWAAVQHKLKQIIDAEDKSKPLNDDELVEKLKAEGIDLARRTVAKYRKQLHIPPARQRREY